MHYSKILKILAAIPVVVGLLTFIEVLMPYKIMDTVVVSKEKEYRAKNDMMTYIINFQGINDQFTEEIYTQLRKGDQVQLSLTFFNKQVRKVKRLRDNMQFENNTLEPYALFVFAFAFLLAALSWVKSGALNDGQSIILSMVILFGLIQGIRMLI